MDWSETKSGHLEDQVEDGRKIQRFSFLVVGFEEGPVAYLGRSLNSKP
jgi:hypothetical protein